MDTYAWAFDEHRKGNFGMAEMLYGKTIRDDPRNASAHSNLGVLRFQKRRYDEAIINYQDAICLDPNYAHAHSNMGAALVSLNRPAEALPFCARAYKLDPTCRPALSNLGDALFRLGRSEEAQAVFEEVLRLEPGFQKALVNLGLVRAALEDIDGARVLLTRAMTQEGPRTHDAALAQKNLGVLALGAFDFADGWANYEARFEADGMRHRYGAEQEWDGTPQPHGCLLVVAEQGLGDEILYASMLKDVCRAYKGRVIWEADSRLHALLPNNIPNLTLETRQLVDPGTHPTATHRIDAGSLGKYMRASIADFPAAPHLRRPADQRVCRRRIGISWRSITPQHGAGKTVPLAEWADALSVMCDAGCDIVSLQYGDTPELAAAPDSIRRPGFDARYDIVALAGEIASCAHVVTVSNTTAHLAGALGVPATILVPDGMARYWYWGFGETTPWYASAQLARRRGRPWADVLRDVAVDITRKTA